MTGERIFTTWLTSVDRVDHAVTDEEFAENPGAPKALCGVEVRWGPMELPSSPACEACRAVLRAAAATAGCCADAARAGRRCAGPSDLLRTVAMRLHSAIARRPIEWFAPADNGMALGTAKLSPTSSQTAVARADDRAEPPAAARWPSTVAGAPAGEETASRCVSSPAHVVPDTVPVTGARSGAAQPSSPQCTDPGAVGAGLGGLPTSAHRPPSPSRVGQQKNAGIVAATHDAGTVPPAPLAGVPVGRRYTQLPAAASLSAATPDGRDTGQQDQHRPWGPRRCLLLAHPTTHTPVELDPRAGPASLFVPERPEGAAPVTYPILGQR